MSHGFGLMPRFAVYGSVVYNGLIGICDELCARAWRIDIVDYMQNARSDKAACRRREWLCCLLPNNRIILNKDKENRKRGDDCQAMTKVK